MTAKPIFSFQIYWNETDSDFKNCHRCDALIIGKMFHPIIQTGASVEETTFSDIKIRLCEPCYKVKVLGVDPDTEL